MLYSQKKFNILQLFFWVYNHFFENYLYVLSLCQNIKMTQPAHRHLRLRCLYHLIIHHLHLKHIQNDLNTVHSVSSQQPI